MSVKTFVNGEWIGIDKYSENIGKCRICNKDNYIVSVVNVPHKEKFQSDNAIKMYGGIPVDACIGKEIQWLIGQGVITRACCCGHDKYSPNCLISEESISLAAELGYSPIYYSPGIYKIVLKQCKSYHMGE
jgi:hypothetical protein